MTTALLPANARIRFLAAVVTSKAYPRISRPWDQLVVTKLPVLVCRSGTGLLTTAKNEIEKLGTPLAKSVLSISKSGRNVIGSGLVVMQ